jgi:hypothetical protein
MRDTAHAEVAPNAEQNNFCLLNKVCVVFIFSISSFGSILSGEVICCNTAVGDAQGNSKVEEVKKMSMSHPEDLGQRFKKTRTHISQAASRSDQVGRTVTPCHPFASLRGNSARGLSRAAARSFAALRMTELDLAGGEELSRAFDLALPSHCDHEVDTCRVCWQGSATCPQPGDLDVDTTQVALLLQDLYCCLSG